MKQWMQRNDDGWGIDEFGRFFECASRHALELFGGVDGEGCDGLRHGKTPATTTDTTFCTILLSWSFCFGWRTRSFTNSTFENQSGMGDLATVYCSASGYFRSGIG